MIDNLRMNGIESGKPLKEGMGEVMYSSSYFHLYADEVMRSDGRILPSVSGDKFELMISFY